jgi:hypothetical protein
MNPLFIRLRLWKNRVRFTTVFPRTLCVVKVSKVCISVSIGQIWHCVKSSGTITKELIRPYHRFEVCMVVKIRILGCDVV